MPKSTENKSVLNRLKGLALLVGRLVKQIWILPSLVVGVFRQRRRQSVLDAAEAERLDRIRNPSDYLGK